MAEVTNPLHMFEVSPDEKSMNGALGITDERAAALVKTANKLHRTGESITDAMTHISKECTHANELGWIMFMYGSNMAEKRGLGGSGAGHIEGLQAMLKVLTSLEAMKKDKKGKKKKIDMKTSRKPVKKAPPKKRGK